MATIGQVTLLGLFDEMDIKGTCSGKKKIFTFDGRPQDALGYMLQRLGYSLIPDSNKYSEMSSMSLDPEGIKGNSYDQAAQLLGISNSQLRTIWKEIDREASTNKSIKNTVIRTCNLQNEFPLQ